MLDTLTAEVSNFVAHKVYNIYYLVLDIRGLLTPGLITPFRSDVKTDLDTQTEC